jgi:hypothetical protein
MRRRAATALIITMLSGAACAPEGASPSASPSNAGPSVPGIGRIEPGGYTHAPVAEGVLDRGTDARLRKALAAPKPIKAMSLLVSSGLSDVRTTTTFSSGSVIVGGGECLIYRTSAEVLHAVHGTTRLSDQASTSVTEIGAKAYAWSRNVLCTFDVDVVSIHAFEPRAEYVRMARAATKVLALAGVRLIDTAAH